MNPSQTPIATLRAHLDDILREASGEIEAEQFCRQLEGDTRAGARALGERGLRRIGAAVRERARLASLFERRSELRARGLHTVAGVDEVGVGPLAGPVVAAAVVLCDEVDLPGLNDSKKLSPAAREALDVQIRSQARGVGIGEVPPREIDAMGIYKASLEAMRRAVQQLEATCPPDHLLVDARVVPGVRLPREAQTPLIHGDAIDGSIAAASIVAKVYRDGLMRRLGESHPGYGFARHMGYGTAQHLEAIARLGITQSHRRSFAPVAAAARP